MNNHTDRELEEYLKGNSKLSELYHSDNDLMPPSYLDKAILKESKIGVKNKNKPGWLNHFLTSDWLTPVTSFAMITLMAIGVYMLMVPDDTVNQNGSLAGSSPLKNTLQKKKTHRDSKEVHQAVPVKSIISTKDNQTNKLDTTIDKSPTPKTKAVKSKLAYSRKSPNQWLKHIKSLYENKEVAAARLEFEKFRRIYPKYPAKKVIGKSPVLRLDPNHSRKTLRKK